MPPGYRLGGLPTTHRVLAYQEVATRCATRNAREGRSGERAILLAQNGRQAWAHLYLFNLEPDVAFALSHVSMSHILVRSFVAPLSCSRTALGAPTSDAHAFTRGTRTGWLSAHVPILHMAGRRKQQHVCRGSAGSSGTHHSCMGLGWVGLQAGRWGCFSVLWESKWHGNLGGAMVGGLIDGTSLPLQPLSQQGTLSSLSLLIMAMHMLDTDLYMGACTCTALDLLSCLAWDCLPPTLHHTHLPLRAPTSPPPTPPAPPHWPPTTPPHTSTSHSLCKWDLGRNSCLLFSHQDSTRRTVEDLGMGLGQQVDHWYSVVSAAAAAFILPATGGRLSRLSPPLLCGRERYYSILLRWTTWTVDSLVQPLPACLPYRPAATCHAWVVPGCRVGSYNATTDLPACRFYWVRSPPDIHTLIPLPRTYLW